MPEVYVTSADADGLSAEELQEKSLEKSPLRLAWEDTCLLFQRLPWLVDAVRPIKSAKPLPGVKKSTGSLVGSYLVTTVVTMLSIPALIVLVPALLMFPGWMVVLAYGALLLVIAAISKPTWGSFVLQSQVPLPEPAQFPRERWLFINGIAVSHVLMQGTIDRLSATFRRPITGLHNRSWGIIGDILECLVQRAFRYHTQSVRISCEGIRNALLDEEVDKVVVIAHSQGGIITSLALDDLYATLPTRHFKKLEIYTFGSAASDFHNPLIDHIDTDSTKPSNALTNASSLPTHPVNEAPELRIRKPGPTFIEDHLVHFIEHYCNGRDIVPLWGVLWHVQHCTSSRYSGRVFRHEKQTGHLFDQHYLETMLPLDKIDDVDDSQMFLNHVCEMTSKEAGVLKAHTFGPDSLSTQGDKPFIATVRDLSRLWRYVGGNSP